MTQKALPHENLSTKPQKISQNYELPGQIFDMEAIFSDQ